jgi:FkbH-like protein
MMNSALYAGLGWLADCKDFRGNYRDIAECSEPAGAALRRLATHGLSAPQLQRIATLIGDLKARGQSTAPLVPLKLGVLGTGTLSLVDPVIRGTAPRHGFTVDCVMAEYGQVEQGALDPGSTINRADCDVVLVAFDYRGLPLGQAATDEQDAGDRVERSIETLRSVCRGVRANSNAQVILQTLVPAPETLFGSLDSCWAGSVQSMVAAFNRAIVAECRDASVFLLDTAHLANTVGLANWHDPGQWNLAKFTFSAELLPLYADHVCRLLAAMHGKSRRALVLDLDNTLWGGVIGDDGLHGIIVGEGEATGEAFLNVQRLALTLRERGVVLAVSSKNTDEIARTPFADHPDMLLQQDHFASFRANWEDKASNIRAIAEELALGLDAFVFLDDNPAERELVRLYLPEVAVPELPEDPALYARTLAAAGYFEAVAYSQEDRARADAYKANAQRASLMSSANGIDDFLSGLQMQVTVQPFDVVGRSRIQQLIVKSNQFNLTTQRYTEAEIAEMEADPKIFTLQVRLKDRLGDNGMISVVICREAGADTWEIDTWLMSCRVLRRGVETMVLKEIVEQAREHGIRTLIGTYRPTPRNALVKGHYAELGFTFENEDEAGETRWSLATDTPVEAPWFDVVRRYPVTAGDVQRERHSAS